MTFFSLEFTIIFLAFFSTYWALNFNTKAQNYLILTFNYFLIYSFSPYFVFIVFFHTFFTSYFGLFIHYKKTKYALFTGAFFAVLYLCFFKYYDFVYADFKEILYFLNYEFLAKNLEIAFPIGISFYTFASVTYLVSIYKNEQTPANFLSLACYLSFFATLLAGPIAKSTFLIPQFETKREFKNSDLILVLIIFGIVKKVLIANHLGIFVSEIFSQPYNFSSIKVLIAIYLYGVWIYCDFSGYVDIVTAFALAIGFTLPINFNMPYVALNLKEFWQRWHITLSNFIKEYIYIPLGGNRYGFLMTQLNLFIAFFLSGIWHGVGINFIIWGLLHGFGIIFLNLMQKLKFKISSLFPLISMSITYTFVSLTWIFFDRSDISDIVAIFSAVFNNKNQINVNEILTLLIMFVTFVIYPYFTNFKDFCLKCLSATPTILKPFVLAIVLSFIFAAMPDGIPNFIYASF